VIAGVRLGQAARLFAHALELLANGERVARRNGRLRRSRSHDPDAERSDNQ
jgi:hypothetical protein